MVSRILKEGENSLFFQKKAFNKLKAFSENIELTIISQICDII